MNLSSKEIERVCSVLLCFAFFCSDIDLRSSLKRAAFATMYKGRGSHQCRELFVQKRNDEKHYFLSSKM